MGWNGMEPQKKRIKKTVQELWTNRI
jgi:hypothetical protein